MMNLAQITVFLTNFVIILGNLITFAILGRVLVSWFSMGPGASHGPVAQFLISSTDPFISMARKIPHRIGMIDLSPIIALLAVDLLVRLIVVLLSNLSG